MAKESAGLLPDRIAVVRVRPRQVHPTMIAKRAAEYRPVRERKPGVQSLNAGFFTLERMGDVHRAKSRLKAETKVRGK